MTTRDDAPRQNYCKGCWERAFPPHLSPPAGWEQIPCEEHPQPDAVEREMSFWEWGLSTRCKADLGENAGPANGYGDYRAKQATAAERERWRHALGEMLGELEDDSVTDEILVPKEWFRRLAALRGGD